MKITDRLLLPLIARLNSADLTFGLGSALIVSALAVVIASAVAYHYAQ